MFSQFTQLRQAVESLAQHSPKPSQDLSDEHNSSTSADSSQELRGTPSSAQLAEAALTNLRKSLVSQRSGSPVPARVASPSAERTARHPTQRTTLEDRLRAKFVLGEASNSSSPTLFRASSTPVSVTDHPLSPTSITPPVSSAPETPIPRPPVSQAPVPQEFTPDILASHTSVAEITSSPETSNADVMRSPTSTPLPESPIISPRVEAPAPLTPGASWMPVTLASLSSPVGSPPPSEGLHTTEDMAGVDHPLNVLSSSGDGLDDHAADEPDELVTENATTLADLEDGSCAMKTEDLSPGIAGQASPVVDPPSEDAPPAMNLQSPTPAIVQEKFELIEERVVESELNDPVASSEAQPPLDSPIADLATTEEHALDELEASSFANVEDTDRHAIAITSVPLGASHPDIDGLQKRLKLVEQRFADVSTSFKRLQAEKLAADKVIKDLTPLETVQEVDVLRDYLQNMNLKTEMAQDEIRRLTGKLTRQDERIEELRDIHRLESKSRSDQIDKLRSQVEEAEALLKVSQGTIAHADGESAKRQVEIDRLQAETERAKGFAKEEEEKRVKAVTLLKTVRQKLVKAEKDRDELQKEFQTFKEKEKAEREKDQAEKLDLRGEIDRAYAEKDTAILGLRAQFDKDVAALKEKYEKEITVLKGQYELEAITTKTALKKDIESKASQVSDLESSVRILSRDKDELFDQLQLRQAELESSRSHLESLEGQSTEFQYQLREASDRIALLSEELADARKDQEPRFQGSGPSPEEVTRMLSAAEAKYESRISDLRSRLTTVEHERDEGEADWSRKLSEKVRELEVLKSSLSSSVKTREEESESVGALKQEIAGLEQEVRVQQKRVSDLQAQAEKVGEVENAAKSQLSELGARAAALQQKLEDSQGREVQLRANNKTLREELRKVQTSAALLERQRNPGVGYWASRPENSSDTRSPRSSVSELAGESLSRPGSPSIAQSEEEVNFEYLRNVILQFLEHKEMRPHLVRILSTILRFTPQETRRLVSKV